MKNINLRVLLSAICMVSIMAAFKQRNRGAVGFDQVVQIINSAGQENGSFSRCAWPATIPL